MTTMAEIKAPRGKDLAYATLQAVERRDGSTRTKELTDTKAVLEITGLAEGELKTVSMDTIQMRMAWARTGLKSSGHLDNSQKGVWSLTVEGRSLLLLDPSTAQETARQAYERGWAQRKLEKALREAAGASADSGEDWKDGLLQTVKSIEPVSFARLFLRLLKESGFRYLEPVGQNGDDKFVGMGVYRHHLISSRVYVQCQRRADSITAREVREFVEAMSIRANRGLFITTSKFTRDAQKVARDGAQPIDLIEGEELCDLLKEYGLGVKIEMREHVTVNQEFFDAL